MEVDTTKIKSVRSLLDSQAVTLVGEGNFVLGLNSEECLQTCLEEELPDSTIIVPLFMVSIWKTSGSTLNPINRDLKCFVDAQLVCQECNLIPGSKIEVGDKEFEFFDGPVPKPRKSRALPPTPGVHVSCSPPPKPSRNGEDPLPQPLSDQVQGEEDQSGEWCFLQPPGSDEELINNAFGSPEKMVQAAAGFISRQINQYTDTRMTSHLNDSIFKLFQDVENHRPDILTGFLLAVAKEMTLLPEEEKGKPMHDAIIAMLTDTLQEFLDPLEYVLTCLCLLRALSHIGSNLAGFLLHQTATSVLGSMAALRDSAEVQRYSLDILARVATVQPAFHDKLPLRETTVELVNLALTQHSSDLHIAQAGCRTLANLSSTAFDLAFCIIETGRPSDPNHLSQLDKVMTLLDLVQGQSTPKVKAALAAFSTDLSVVTEARRFLFFLSKLNQLHLKRDAWLNTSAENDDQPDTEGILKRCRSFENLRTPNRRVSFEDAGNDFLTSTDSEMSIPVNHKAEILSHTVEYLTQPDLSQDSVDADRAEAASGATDAEPTPVSTSADSAPLPPPRRAQGGPKLPPRRPVSRKAPVPQTVDYTQADITFLQQMTFAQVTCRVCSLACHSDVSLALKLVDQPVRELVKDPTFFPEVQEFVISQYAPTLTLMDIQPALVISLVDAVRYRSVALEVLHQRLLEVMACCETGAHRDHCVLATKLLTAMMADSALVPVLALPDVVKKCAPLLEKFESASPRSPTLRRLKKHFSKLSLD